MDIFCIKYKVTLKVTRRSLFELPGFVSSIDIARMDLMVVRGRS